MGKLGDIFGDEFEEKYNDKAERRMEQQKKVDKKTLLEICYQAVHGGGFDGEEPRFTFDAGEVEHDVVLMESPKNDINKFKYKFDDTGNISLGMFHVGDLWSCIFNEETMPLVDRIQTDELYLVVGRYQENVKDKGTADETVYQNISPVRGILPVAKVKQYADKYRDEMQGTSKQEQAQKQKQQLEEEDDDIDLGGADDDEIDKSKIVQVFGAIGDQKPEILKKTVSGDSDAIDKLVTVTNNNLDSHAGEERILDIFEDEVEEIDGRGEEDNDDDDGLDLGGLDDEEAEDEPEPEPDDEPEPEESSSDSDDDSVDDWF